MILQDAEWSRKNFGGCKLGNSLRTKRLQSIAVNMLSAPDQSLPAQNLEDADLKALYRLMDQDAVTFEAIANTHWELTRQNSCERRLLVCDMTDISLHTRNAVQGLGILGNGNGKGIQLHSCLAINSENGMIEGTAGATLYYRKRAPKSEKRTERLKRDRESTLWAKVVNQVGLAPKDKTWIYVFDRGGDNFEAFCAIKSQHCQWVIRAGKLNRKVFNSQGEYQWLEEAIKHTTELGQYELSIRSRPRQPKRSALLKVSVTSVRFPRPTVTSQEVKAYGTLEIQTNVVIVEEQLKKGSKQKPIKWILLTSLPTTTFKDAWQVIEDYEKRWLIEEYHKVLKTGCNIEGHSLRTTGRLEALIGLISVIGVRLLSLKMHARIEPSEKAIRRVPSTWIEAIAGVRPRTNIANLTVRGFFHALAKLGGFRGRNGDGDPGWQTIWKGYLRMHWVIEGMQIRSKKMKKGG